MVSQPEINQPSQRQPVKSQNSIPSDLPVVREFPEKSLVSKTESKINDEAQFRAKIFGLKAQDQMIGKLDEARYERANNLEKLMDSDLPTKPLILDAEKKSEDKA